MTSQTLLGWVPRAPAAYYRPVQVEDATGGLTGAGMPDGRGILMWPNGGAAKFAVVASPQAWLADDIVDSGDIGTIVSGSVRRTAVYNIDGGIYATVDIWTGSNWTLRIYSADNPSNPTTWSLEATVKTTNTPGAIFGFQDWAAGIPIKLDSGRWVLAQAGGETAADPAWLASGIFAHAWYSDGGAAGPWVHVLEYGHYVSGFTRTDYVSSQVVADPAAGGDLYFTSYALSPNQSLVWRSQDDGESWTFYNSLANAVGRPLSPVIDNGVTAHALWNTNVYTPTGDPTDMQTGWTAGPLWVAPGMSNDTYSRRAIIAGSSVYYFAEDQVAPGGGNPWTVGRVVFGGRGAWR